MSEYLNYFSESERKSIKRFAQFRDKSLLPIIKLLDVLKFTPDSLSLLSLLVLSGFIYFANKNIYYALIFVVIHVIFDSLDGGLARYQKSASNKGAIFDIVVDQTAMVIGVLTLIYFSMIDPFWSAFYMVSYIIMITFLVLLNALKNPVRYIIRTKYFFFIILFIDAYFETNLLRPFLIIFSIYMTCSSIYLIGKFRTTIQK